MLVPSVPRFSVPLPGQGAVFCPNPASNQGGRRDTALPWAQGLPEAVWRRCAPLSAGPSVTAPGGATGRSPPPPLPGWRGSGCTRSPAAHRGIPWSPGRRSGPRSVPALLSAWGRFFDCISSPPSALDVKQNSVFKDIETGTGQTVLSKRHKFGGYAAGAGYGTSFLFQIFLHSKQHGSNKKSPKTEVFGDFGIRPVITVTLILIRTGFLSRSAFLPHGTFHYSTFIMRYPTPMCV